MKPKLTPWFPADVRPVRPGFYEREWESISTIIDAGKFLNDYFDGDLWTLSFHDKSLNAAKIIGKFDLRWRGLAEDPAKAK
jgi:hypothetical protein